MKINKNECGTAFAFTLATLLLGAATTRAVTFTNIYSFPISAFTEGTNPLATNSAGANPYSLVLSGNVIYGTANSAGLYGYGTVFRVNTDGTHFTNLFSFNLGTYDTNTMTYPDSTGAQPNPGLLLVSNTLYGTTFYGGLHDAGTIFKINTDSSGFALIHAFNFADGQSPQAGLTLYSNALYGTTVGGGSNTYGTVFKVNLSDLGFGTVYNFTNFINPYGGVVVSNNTAYGFGQYGGPSFNGVVYSVALGGGYTELFDFNGANGWAPYCTPVLAGNTLYGVTYQGGTNFGGSVFRIGTDGLHFTNLYSFPRQSGANTDGANPYDLSGLVLSGNTLYGTTSVSGSGGQGTVFQINTDGSGFNVLHSFQYTDGGQPDSLVLDGGTLYGVAFAGIQGISTGNGGLFAIVLEPTLNIALDNKNVVLTWDDPSYSLYTAPSATSTFTKILGATNPYTNAITGTQKVFRLGAN